MAVAEIQVPEGLTTDGLLGKRYIARWIDGAILTVATLGVVTVERAVFDPKAGLETWLLNALTYPLLWIGYGTAMECSSWQATLGKRVMRLKVYDRTGERLDPGQAMIRNMAKDGPFLLLSLVPDGRPFAWLWLVAHLVVIHRSPVAQAIHDRFAGTWVAARQYTTRLHWS
jgi:uncharacterized RDD family membrane protein YckC